MMNLLFVVLLVSSAAAQPAPAPLPYDAARAALVNISTEQVKQLDALLKVPSGPALLADVRAAEFLSENGSAIALFRRAAEEKNDGFLFVAKPTKVDPKTPLPQFGDFVKLLKLALLDAKMNAARKQNAAAEKDLLAAAGFLVQMSEQRYPSLLARLVGQLAVQKAYPILSDSLRGAPSKGYLKELSSRLELLERNEDFMRSAFLEEGELRKAAFHESLTPEMTAKEVAKMSAWKRPGLKRLMDAEYYSRINSLFATAVDEEVRAVDAAFRTNSAAPLEVFRRQRAQDLLSRKQSRADFGEWEQIKDVFKGSARIKQAMAEASVDVMLGIETPPYVNLIPRCHAALNGFGVLRAAAAVKLHQRERKRLPSRLDQALASVPKDSFNGFEPLRYAVEGKRFKVYSLGPDGKDDHGAALDWEAYDADPSKNAGDFVFAD